MLVTICDEYLDDLQKLVNMELKTLHFSINFLDFCQLQKPLKVL